MAHTPGPWRPFAWGAKVGVTGDLDTADIALVSGFDTNRSIDEEMANANLIAAAPDLLAALKHLMAEARGKSDIFYEAHRRAYEAIKKAEGRL